jgi:GT2 family glycosyltransferase
MATGKNSVAAAILAYSRFELLKDLVGALRAQTRPPDGIIVVNQGADARIGAWLAEQRDIRLVTQGNRGSAGGFSRCLQESIAGGYGWTWIFDDDAVPEPDALERLTASPHFADAEATSYLASRITKPDGKTYMSPLPIEHNDWYGTVLSDACVRVSHACWLGMLVHSEAVKKFGLPIEEFFLWDEDVEFSGRLGRSAPAYCVLSSAIKHYQRDGFDPFSAGDAVKLQYWARNRIARAKIEPGSLVKRAARALKASLEFTSMVLRRKAPLRTFKAIFAGLFLFWPKVRPWKPLEPGA